MKIRAELRPRLLLLLLMIAILACSRGDQPLEFLGLELRGSPGGSGTKAPAESEEPVEQVAEPPPFYTPTPDPVREPPDPQEIPEWYTVQYGDSLNGIAGRMGVGANQILVENGLPNPNFLAVGQILHMPTPLPQAPSPSFKIIPDAELVNGESALGFSATELIRAWNGALNRYSEFVDGEELSGAQIVERVASKHSVNPRLLLAVLEYQGGWLTMPERAPDRYTYELGYERTGFEGLYRQLSWAADQLNRGYYQWRAGWAGPYILSDGTAVPPGPGINAGTAAVQWLISQLYPPDSWRTVIGEDGFFRVYEILFGNPFAGPQHIVIPDNLEQPSLQLPFEEGKVWSFTGGPHSGWGNWAAWSALDFAPPGNALGCVLSNEWVVAIADGPIVRSSGGEVIQDLDGDGLEGTGWTIQYLHIETRDRVPAGTYLEQGDRIGHPSCEGGVSSGTHLHLSRNFNGEWIPADGALPFDLDGWVSEGDGAQYDGALMRGDVRLEACSCRFPLNQITR
ncbi:MAG: LysM peptidoglycan-binding domain-containing protein [Anaerolineales bacterium]